MIPANARKVADYCGWEIYVTSGPKDNPGEFYALSRNGDVISEPSHHKLISAILRGSR